CVAPRPIALTSTINANGEVNLAPFSFFNVFSANPPVAVFSPARRGRDASVKHTYLNVKSVPECVINIVSFDMLQQMNITSTEYASGVNEFVKSGFTQAPSIHVKPPRVAESPAQLECRVNDVIELGTGGAAGNLVICEVLAIHVRDEVMDEQGRISPAKMDHVARMGGHWYSRANAGLFELPQPVDRIALGWDALPMQFRQSAILTGNQLGQLAAVESIPDETRVNEYKLLELDELFMSHDGEPRKLEEALHRRAAQLLDAGKVEDAWLTLLAFNG
ncbi:MAG: flavin reductase, partial [Flavobacteriales bacterium]|nr:flavin reductase [Flavobacteriales bacterium]